MIEFCYNGREFRVECNVYGEYRPQVNYPNSAACPAEHPEVELLKFEIYYVKGSKWKTLRTALVSAKTMDAIEKDASEMALEDHDRRLEYKQAQEEEYYEMKMEEEKIERMF